MGLKSNQNYLCHYISHGYALPLWFLLYFTWFPSVLLLIFFTQTVFLEHSGPMKAMQHGGSILLNVSLISVCPVIKYVMVSAIKTGGHPRPLSRTCIILEIPKLYPNNTSLRLIHSYINLTCLGLTTPSPRIKVVYHYILASGSWIKGMWLTSKARG